MRTKAWLLGVWLLLSCSAFAQLRDADPDWKESELPAPPEFKADQTIELEMPRHMTVRLGVDPQTIRITDDGIVRYVVVARSPGTSTIANYEGIRCLTGEVKIYARYSSSGIWQPIPNAEWKPLNGNQPSLHALAFARQAACEGRAAASGSAAIIISKLKSTPREHGRN